MFSPRTPPIPQSGSAQDAKQRLQYYSRVGVIPPPASFSGSPLGSTCSFEPSAAAADAIFVPPTCSLTDFFLEKVLIE